MSRSASHQWVIHTWSTPKHEPKHHEPKHHEPKHHEPKHHEPKHHEPKHHEPKKQTFSSLVTLMQVFLLKYVDNRQLHGVGVRSASKSWYGWNYTIDYLGHPVDDDTYIDVLQAYKDSIRCLAAKPASDDDVDVVIAARHDIHWARSLQDQTLLVAFHRDIQAVMISLSRDRDYAVSLFSQRRLSAAHSIAAMVYNTYLRPETIG